MRMKYSGTRELLQAYSRNHRLIDILDLRTQRGTYRPAWRLETTGVKIPPNINLSKGLRSPWTVPRLWIDYIYKKTRESMAWKWSLGALQRHKYTQCVFPIDELPRIKLYISKSIVLTNTADTPNRVDVGVWIQRS